MTAIQNRDAEIRAKDSRIAELSTENAQLKDQVQELTANLIQANVRLGQRQLLRLAV